MICIKLTNISYISEWISKAWAVLQPLFLSFFFEFKFHKELEFLLLCEQGAKSVPVTQYHAAANSETITLLQIPHGFVSQECGGGSSEQFWLRVLCGIFAGGCGGIGSVLEDLAMGRPLFLHGSLLLASLCFLVAWQPQTFAWGHTAPKARVSRERREETVLPLMALPWEASSVTSARLYPLRQSPSPTQDQG